MYLKEENKMREPRRKRYEMCSSKKKMRRNIYIYTTDDDIYTYIYTKRAWICCKNSTLYMVYNHIYIYIRIRNNNLPNSDNVVTVISHTHTITLLSVLLGVMKTCFFPCWFSNILPSFLPSHPPLPSAVTVFTTNFSNYVNKYYVFV